MNRVYVVTCEQDETAFNDSWTNYKVVGCFYKEKDAEVFAKSYAEKIKEIHKGEHGWGIPCCEVIEMEIK